MFNRLIQGLLFVFLVTLLAVPSVVAQGPGPGPGGAINLTVVPTDTGKGFKLTWTAFSTVGMPPGTTVEHYLVRRLAHNGVDPLTPADSVKFDSVAVLPTGLEYKDYPARSKSVGYYYMVRVKLSNGMYLPSNLVFVVFGQIATTGPITLTGEYIAPNVARLNWSAPSGATVQKYYVLRVPIPNPLIPADTTLVIVRDSTIDKTYRDSVQKPLKGGFGYKIRARLTSGAITESNGIYVDMNPPLPTGIALTLTGLESGKGFKLNWVPPQNTPVDYYLVTRAFAGSGTNPVLPAPTAFMTIDSLVGKGEYKDTSVTSLGVYFYQVWAKLSGASKIPSNVVFGMLQPMDFKLAAFPDDGRKAKLNWINPPANTTHYFVFRAPVTSAATNLDSLSFVRIDSVSPRFEYRDTSLNVPAAGGSYAYYIRAFSAGNGTNSNKAFVYIGSSTPAVTFRLSAYTDSTGLGQLKWLTPENTAVNKYLIYRSPLSDPSSPYNPEQTQLIDSTTQLQYTDSLKNVPADVRAYAYIVKARPSTGKTVESNVAVIVMAPPAILENIKLSSGFISPGKRGLGWLPPAGVLFDRFYIYRMPVSTENRDVINVASFSLLDSTNLTVYVDSLLRTKADSLSSGFAYKVFGRSGGRTYESNIAFVVVMDRIELKGYTDYDGSIKLNWTKPYNLIPQYYLVFRTRIDSAGRIDSVGWSRIDTVVKEEYRDRPTAVNGKGFFYYVQARDNGAGSLKSNLLAVYWTPPVAQPFLLNGRIDGGAVLMSWNQPTGVTSPFYVIYRAILPRNSTKLDSTVQFVRIDSTSNRELKDSPPTSQSNSFAYYVGVKGSTTKSNAILVFIYNVSQSLDKVYIASEPKRYGQVGALYTYQPSGVSSDSTSTFKWYLGDRPSGMSIDSATGLIQWTPALKGWFKINVFLVSSKGGKASQEYYVSIAGGRGFVQGQVTDTTGAPITPVLIKLFKRDAQTSFEYSAITDSSGNYRFDVVDVGSYNAYAIPLRPDYVPQWYYEKRSPDQANPITVADSATVVINFRLRSKNVQLAQFSLAGFVRDTLNKPLPGAVVVFGKAAFILNSAKNLGAAEQQMDNYKDLFNALRQTGLGSSFGLNGTSLEIFRAVTDSAGRYSIRMPQDAYIGVAFAQGHRKMFYNQRTDLLSANLLKLTKDTTNITFVLRPVPNLALGSISGVVSDSAKGIAVPSRMLAFRDKRDGLPTDAYYADTDASGNYTINELPPGDYYILAVPLGNYAPAFYAVAGAATSWKRATMVTVAGNNVSGIDLFVRPINRIVAGYTYVGGTVLTTTGTGGTLGKGAGATGVNGTIVYATASDGSVAGYGVTDETGAFTIPGLAPQSYSITTDKVGYEAPTSAQTVTPTYDAAGNPVSSNANFTINPTGTTGVEEIHAGIPSTYELRQNFPNPFNPSTRISFNFPTRDRITLTVFNLLGQKVATLYDGIMEAGVHAVTWNAKNEAGQSVATGVYLYQIKTNNFLATKKMILLR